MLRKLIAAAAAGAVIATAPVAQANAQPACEPTKTFFSAGYKGTSHNLPNPGGIFPWEGGYNSEQNRLTAETVEIIDSYAQTCPESQIKIVGYSYGAAVTHTALETIDTRPYADRVHVKLYGNPRHPGGIEDTLSGIPLTGIRFRGPGITPQNVGSFESHCNPRDAICDFPHPIKNLVKSVDHVVGYFTGAHRYPEMYQEFV